MKLCIFSGTFNPIHNAHLQAGQYVIDNFEFDKILFIPAYKPPHKDYDLSMCNHRLRMVELAIKGNKNFSVSDIEYQNDGKSYSYLTVLELYKKYSPEGKISFIIGTDAFEKIESWYEAEKLKKIVDFIVFVRSNKSVNLERLKQSGYNFCTAKMKFNNISSTNLRKLVANGQNISKYVTKEVEDYILENGLYKN